MPDVQLHTSSCVPSATLPKHRPGWHSFTCKSSRMIALVQDSSGFFVHTRNHTSSSLEICSTNPIPCDLPSKSEKFTSHKLHVSELSTERRRAGDFVRRWTKFLLLKGAPLGRVLKKLSAGPVSWSLFSEGLVVQVVPSGQDSRTFDCGCG